MRKVFGGFAWQVTSNALAFFAMMVLLLPSSPSVLCIAPGSHIAVEDINALCCVSSAISPLSDIQPNSAFDKPGNCRNCTDIPLASNGNGVLSPSGSSAMANPLDAEFLDTTHTADLSASLNRSGQIGSPDAPVPIYPSIPLRC